MSIEFYTKHVYGIAREYPVDPKQAEILYALTQEKTLSSRSKWALSALGCTFVEVLPPRAFTPGQQTALTFK